MERKKIILNFKILLWLWVTLLSIACLGNTMAEATELSGVTKKEQSEEVDATVDYSTDKQSLINRGICDEQTTILKSPKMGIDSQGSWWTDEDNYDESKYEELKSAVIGDTIKISNARELAAVSKVVSWPKDGDKVNNLEGVMLELTGDIDLTGYQWKPIGSYIINNFNPFNGIFDAKDFTIRNMSIGYPSANKSLSYVGLFGYCGSNSIVKNAVLSDYEIGMDIEIANSIIGGLVGYNAGIIEHCTMKKGNFDINISKGNIFIGGGVGNSYGMINDCSVLETKINVRNTDLNYTNFIGGFVGVLSGDDSVVSTSKTEGVEIDRGGFVGGFVGVGRGKISNCYSDINIRKPYFSGGFAYRLTKADVINCYSKGDISCSDAGGFSNEINESKVGNCYSACNMSGYFIGGFVLRFKSAKLTYCYASGNLEGCYNNSSVSGFASHASSLEPSLSEISNCYFAGSIFSETNNITGSGFTNNDNSSPTSAARYSSNYTLSEFSGKGTVKAAGFSAALTDEDELNSNFFYSNIGRATRNNKNGGITRILELMQPMTGKRNPVTYTLHKDDLPGGAKVTSFHFDDNIPGAIIKRISDTSYEVTPAVDYGVLHLTGELTVSNAKLKQPEGDVPEGWEFQVSPGNTTMEVSEDLLLCKVDYEKEQILAPVLDGLQMNAASGILDTENDMVRFNLQERDFGKQIQLESDELKSFVFVPERPKVPVVRCIISADKQFLIFTTNKEHNNYTEENAILPNTNYEYSLNGGKSYQGITSTPDGRIIVQLTAETLSNWSGITNANQILDARLRLAATDNSFRSKAMAEELGYIVTPPEQSEDDFYTIRTETNVEGVAKHVVYGLSEDPKHAKPQGIFKRGTRVILKASFENESYKFLYWKEGERIISEEPTVEMEVTADKTFMACLQLVKPVPTAPKMPTYELVSNSEISVNAIEGQEYAIRKLGSQEYGAWQISGKFKGLAPLTTYQIITRISENDAWEASPASQPLEVTTFKSAVSEMPEPPLLKSIDPEKSTIQIETRAGEEYAIRSKGALGYGSWQQGGVFAGLQPDCAYQIVSRKAAIIGVQEAGTVSQPLEVYLPKQQPDLSLTYTVTFLDGSSVIATETVEKGNAAKAPVIQKTGYQLSWSIPFEHVTSNLIVFAVWNPNVYTVTLHPNKGKMQGNNTYNVVYGSQYGAFPKVIRSKYQFKGWYTKKSGGTKITETMPVNILKDTTYYAQWAKISLKKPSLKSVKNIAGKKAFVIWNKMAGVDGYSIEYSTAKKFTKKATKTVTVSASGRNKLSKTISKLRKGNTYYIRIKTYQKDSAGKTVYSSSSNVKKVIIKN